MKSSPLDLFRLLLLSVAASARAQSVDFQPPPITSRGDAAFGKLPVRVDPLPAIEAELVVIGERGSWRLNKRWEIIINSLQSVEVARLLDVVAKLPPSDARESLRAALYSRWAEADPQAAMNRVPLESDADLRGRSLEALLQGWAHANAAEVTAWAEHLPPGPIKLMAYMAAQPYITANEPKDQGKLSFSGTPEAARREPRAALAEAANVTDRERRLNTYRAIAKQWGATDPAAATQWALALASPEERSTMTDFTASNWIRVDPGKATIFLARQDASVRYLTERAVGAWATRDLIGTVRELRQWPDVRRRNELLVSILPNWIQRNPDEALEYIAGLPTEWEEFHRAYSAALERWGGNEPQRMIALWRKLPVEVVLRFLTNDTVRTVLNADPDGVLGFMMQLPPGRRVESLALALVTVSAKKPEVLKQKMAPLAGADDEIAIRRAVLRRLVESNQMDAALNLYATLPAGQPQAEALQFIANSWGRTEPAKVLVWLRSQPASPVTVNATTQLIRQLAQTDPAAALREIDSLPLSPSRTGALADAVATWAVRDFKAARGYLRSIGDSDTREAATLAVAQRASHADPARGLELLADGELSARRLEAISQISSSWVQNDASAAQGWAERQSNPQVKETVLLNCVYVLSRTNPAMAAALTDRFTLEPIQQQAVASVAQSWTPFDAVAASRWAANLPRGALQVRAIGAVFAYWAQQDPVAATHWATSLPEGSVSDDAWAQVSQGQFARQPAEGIRWAGHIRNSKLRDDTITRFVTYWLRQNRAAAEAWLPTSGVASELVERARQQSGPAR